MPFLDLLIERSPSGFSFSIYRKPTATDLYTHYYSAHPLSTKKGVLIGLFLRAHNLCSFNSLPNEIEHIRSSFLRLKYPAYIINQALSTAKRRFHNPTSREHCKSRYHLTLPNYSQLEHLRPVLRQLGVSTSFSSRNTLGNQLSHTGPLRPPENELPGVYRVECKQCPNGVYFGETGVTLAKRIAGHRTDISKAKDSNALFVHMRDNPGHSFDLKGAKLIYTSNQKPSRQLVESAMIVTNVNCNLRPGDFPVCRITAPIVLKSVKLDKINSLPTTALTVSPTPIIDTPGNSPPVIATSTSIVSTQPGTTGLTQALSTLAINTIIQPQTTIASTQKHLLTLPSAPFSPVANHTRSRLQQPIFVQSSTSPTILQSQARALPTTYSSPQFASLALTHMDSPAPRVLHSQVLLSQCFSPKAHTGAVRKRRLLHNLPVSPYAKSPAIRRLRSRIIPY